MVNNEHAQTLLQRHFCIPGAHGLTPLAIPGTHDSPTTHALGYIFLIKNNEKRMYLYMYVCLCVCVSTHVLGKLENEKSMLEKIGATIHWGFST